MLGQGFRKEIVWLKNLECSSRNLQAAGFCKNRNILFETEKFCKNRKFLFETENFCLKQKISAKTENFCQNRKVDEKALLIKGLSLGCFLSGPVEFVS